MQFADPVVRRVNQTETPHTFTKLLAHPDVLDVRVSSQVGFKCSALVAFLVVETVRTWAATEMIVLHVVSFDLLQDV